MKDKTGMDVGMNQAIIYSSWLWMVNHKILSVQGRVAKKMASASNGSGGGVGSGHNGNLEDMVDSSCKHVVKEIVKEINENMAVLYAHLSGLGKDMELLQKTIKSLCTSMMSLGQKVENIEVKVETATIRVLKEVFEFADAFVPHAEGAADIVVRDLEPGVGGVEELVTTADEASREIDPGSSG